MTMILSLLFSFSSYACDFNIVRAQSNVVTPICLEEYFTQKDLSVSSPDGMQWNDMWVVKNKLPLNRKALTKQILQSAFSGIRGGACEVQMSAGGRMLSLDDFEEVSRTVEGQPGTRLILKSDDLVNTSWTLYCKNIQGQLVQQESGEYFFVFADFYENKDRPDLEGNLAQFLWSFH